MLKTIKRMGRLLTQTGLVLTIYGASPAFSQNTEPQPEMVVTFSDGATYRAREEQITKFQCTFVRQPGNNENPDDVRIDSAVVYNTPVQPLQINLLQGARMLQFVVSPATPRPIVAKADLTNRTFLEFFDSPFFEANSGDSPNDVNVTFDQRSVRESIALQIRELRGRCKENALTLP